MAAFNSAVHEIDPVSGYQIDKDTRLQSGMHSKFPHSDVADPTWPQWVPVHESHIHRRKTEGYPDAISTPGWENSHVNRATGEVTVLAADEDEANLAKGEYKAPDPKDAEAKSHIDENIRRQVHEEFERAKAVAKLGADKQAAIEQAKMEDEESLRRSIEAQDRKNAADEAAKKAADDAARRLHDSVGNAAGLKPMDAVIPKRPDQSVKEIDPVAPRPPGYNPPSANEFPGKLKDGGEFNMGTSDPNAPSSSPSPAAAPLSPAAPSAPIQR
jgi:hypothetical protein